MVRGRDGSGSGGNEQAKYNKRGRQPSNTSGQSPAMHQRPFVTQWGAILTARKYYGNDRSGWPT